MGTSIYEIQASRMGPDELKQANYALRSLPKGLKFLHVVPPSESPKVMGLVGIHDLDALHCFSGIPHCLWWWERGQNEGTMVNHLWMVHYRLSNYQKSKTVSVRNTNREVRTDWSPLGHLVGDTPTHQCSTGQGPANKASPTNLHTPSPVFLQNSNWAAACYPWST